jgi:hypothetical protein
MTRGSKRSELERTELGRFRGAAGPEGRRPGCRPAAVGLIALLACGTPQHAGLSVGGAGPVDSADAPSRRPDAVVLDPPPAIPSAVERSAASGVIALREPLGDDAVRDLVRSVLDAWSRESLDQLVLLLTNDAGPIEARSRGRSALVESWRQRLHAHEYRRLAGLDLFHPERIERYGWKDLSALNARQRPPEMRPEELYVRVPLEVTRIGGERVFGDVLLLLLRRDGAKYLVVAYGELE